MLEACAEADDPGKVLIVEHEQEARLYAIERVQKRLYALCRLVESVKEHSFLKTGVFEASHLRTQGRRPARPSPEDGQPWWLPTAVNHAQEAGVNTRLPDVRLLMRADLSRSSTATDQRVQALVQAAPQEVPELAADGSGSRLNCSQNVPVELAKQYLEALYMSRTPVAYFVKGPLARVRATFAAKTTELIGILRGTILASATMDRKFREIIPELVKELPILETPEARSKPRKKRKWKPKRDKTGFFADEKEYAEHWWRRGNDVDPVPGSDETMSTTIARRSQLLRNRETFLQVVLVLEVMALEASAASAELTPAAATSGIADECQPQPGQEELADKRSRKKKEVDVSAVLETLVDRLCIWYSVDGASPAKSRTNGGNVTHEEAKDDLKSFAAEVVIPFYGARVPDQAYSASKKLGGPAAPTPMKRRPTTAKKPGEAAIRQVPEKQPRKPLARVSTDTLNHSKRVPTLQRSSTDSDALKPLIKREPTETPLDAIPRLKQRTQQCTQTARKRPSLLEQVSFSRREVDLSAMSQVSEAKVRKKAEVDARLREAITNIKKPNRQLATQELAKNADESFAKAVSKARRPVNGQHPRKPVATAGVAATSTPGQVQATPAPRRQKYPDDEQDADSGRTSIVPSSSARLYAQPDQVPGSTFAVPATGHRPRHTNAVEETPSRGFAKFMPAALTRPPGTLLESPTASRTSAAIAATPVKALKMSALVETPVHQTKPSLGGRTYSPLKKHKEQGQGSPDPLTQGFDGRGTVFDVGGKSIYDALGWNDDDDYEALA